ncbi:NAD(P)/FAD-dependent oxidoreductase [Magnetospira sp. QH-2]|uniref:NAD(P)/FAD-dependent oxidoreductase n=1 Tax=Magnetospira sp. (strain QH-2) TaxID=1288970 RepID=UPI0003E81ADA|nr:NAD(P)/FAD-dependent oxidoreductase [Magnetospira sp. QH-2]CCQ73738.1 Sulfide dehydrogenase [flavocytochrome c] flavoprotein chain [Magnetospira sp. QH-2]
MARTSRRTFLQLAGTAGAVSAFGIAGCGEGAARVVVIGGGFGGATAAKYIRKFDPTVQVTLIEPKTHFTSCPFSNLYLGGIRSFDSITFGYDNLRDDDGVVVVHETVTGFDPDKKMVMTDKGSSFPYDKLVVSPGVGFKWEETPGYDMAAAQLVPHAWNGGPQTKILHDQLRAMDDGGVVVIAPPANPFRCPPGPYERASMIAHYLKYNKPKSKVLILDSKDKFSKQGLFMEGWKQHYGDMIEWVPRSKDGKVVSVNAKDNVAETEFEKHKAAVLNYIPLQKANDIAFTMGLADAKGWCPIDHKTFESTLQKNVYVLGDAATVNGMPKSGNAANTQAKVCAAAVVDSLAGREPGVPTTTNTCYSLITPTHGISVTAVYQLTDKGYRGKAGSGGLSPLGEGAKFRKAEANYARGWFANITNDIWSRT